MKNDYIYIKLNKKSEIVLKDICNKIVFTGITDNYGNIKVPICNNNLYHLYVCNGLNTKQVPLIARKNELYCININKPKSNKHCVTILLIDKNYKNIKIKKGEILLWQDTQSQ